MARYKPRRRSDDAMDAYIRRRLRERRMMLGLTQVALGRAIELSFKQIQKYERGTAPLFAARLVQLSRALDVPVTYFYEGGPGMENEPKDASISGVLCFDALRAPELLEIAQAFVSIADIGTRRTMLDLVRQIAAREARQREVAQRLHTPIGV